MNFTPDELTTYEDEVGDMLGGFILAPELYVHRDVIVRDIRRGTWLNGLYRISIVPQTFGFGKVYDINGVLWVLQEKAEWKDRFGERAYSANLVPFYEYEARNTFFLDIEYVG